MAEYSYSSDGGKTILTHRKVWIEKNGEISKGYIVHHKNGNKWDNRIENLELVSRRKHRLKHPRKNEEEITENARNFRLKYIGKLNGNK